MDILFSLVLRMSTRKSSNVFLEEDDEYQMCRTRSSIDLSISHLNNIGYD